MLLTGWEVRIGKNCDRGLENAALGLRPRAAFSLYGPTLSRTITCLSFFLAVNWLTNDWACLRKFVIELAYAPSTNHSLKNLTSERASIYYTKKDVLKNRFFSNYFMSVAFSSPVKPSKTVFSGKSFRVKFEVVLQKQFLSVVANHSKSDFSTVN